MTQPVLVWVSRKQPLSKCLSISHLFEGDSVKMAALVAPCLSGDSVKLAPQHFLTPGGREQRQVYTMSH